MAPSGTKSEDATGDMEFPQFPGEDFLAHAATLYLEQADARLAGRGLLAVAQGHAPRRPAPWCTSRGASARRAKAERGDHSALSCLSMELYPLNSVLPVCFGRINVRTVLGTVPGHR